MKRKVKVQRYKQKKAKEAADQSRKKFINARDVRGVRGAEERDASLGVEFKSRSKAGGIVDKRMGGDDADEGDMLGRMRRVKERKLDKFTLSDTTNDNLTHLGSSIGEATFTEQDREAAKQLRKKDRSEILDEIIDKSRAYREEKKVETEEKEREVTQLDYDWGAISTLLPLRRSEKSSVPVTQSKQQPKEDTPVKAKVLTLTASGKAKLETNTASGEKKQTDRKLQKEMDKILKKAKKDNAEDLQQKDQAEEATEKDAYDLMMLGFEDSVVAKGGERTKSNVEIAAESSAQLFRLQREKSRHMYGGDPGEEEGEGGDKPFQPRYKPTDSNDIREAKARRQASSLFEEYLTSLEQECSVPENIDFTRVDRMLTQLRDLTSVGQVAAVTTARSLLDAVYALHSQELEKPDVPVGSTPFTLIVSSIFSKIFPSSDFRHPVCSPLALYLANCITMPIEDLRTIAVGIFRSSILVDMSKETHRYCGELITFVTNILGMTCKGNVKKSPKKKRKQSDIETEEAAARHEAYLAPLRAEKRDNSILSQFMPLIPRKDDSILLFNKGEKAASFSSKCAEFSIFCTSEISQNNATRHGIILSLYRLAVDAITCYCGGSDSDFLPSALGPLQETLQNISTSNGAWLQKSKHVASVHKQLQSMVDEKIRDAESNRMHLMLQSHRPIPIPLYPPKVTEFEEDEKDERKALKAEYRAERKKAIRQLRADNRYLNQQKQQERSREMERKEETLKNVMAELQDQRRLIKDSDHAKDKMKSLNKKAGKR